MVSFSFQPAFAAASVVDVARHRYNLISQDKKKPVLFFITDNNRAGCSIYPN
jgi:hypothetical protein